LARRLCSCVAYWVGAVGDALGAPVEFMKRTEILQRFGPNGITTFAPAYGGLGRITDDTQMTLFTAEGLLRGEVRGAFRGITSHVNVTAHAYLRWLQTQGEDPAFQIIPSSGETGWLIKQRELHSRRAPGNTCISALKAMLALGEPARNDSKGCDGVMRVAPVGLFMARLRDAVSPEDAFRLGQELAALTHGHPTGSLTAGVLAVLILKLTAGAKLPDASVTAKALLEHEPQHEETLRSILSILSEKVTLNLDPQQVKQAETQKTAADGAVTARLPETSNRRTAGATNLPHGRIGERSD
jgi:ADP-ribosylglycohydrolase